MALFIYRVAAFLIFSPLLVVKPVLYT